VIEKSDFASILGVSESRAKRLPWTARGAIIAA
jgi:hypothetical protein